MLFNSFSFLIFFILIFFSYWKVFNRNIKVQNIFILVMSYVFYGWWDWRFLTLIAFSTLIDYLVALKLGETRDEFRRKLLLSLSLGVNLGLLVFFKYYNFFLENWVEAWKSIHVEMNISSLKIILPVGISFYTFQTLSYTIDVYRRKLKPTKSLINFASFVAFFPQLVAGPIERASNLLPQFYEKRQFSHHRVLSGFHLVIWGLFKKIVIADTCATYVNTIFGNYENMNSLTLILGAVYFAFQIYGDFSGYSDMAIGLARMLGFNLRMNFNFPYFSRDIAEFWRKWHISLSTWFRDYLYIPLGGSHGGNWKKIRNVFVIFLVSGFWHGANWTFIFWGVLNAIYFLPLLLFNKNRQYLNVVQMGNFINSIKTLLNILGTFTLTCIGWVIFRSDTITDAISYFNKIGENGQFRLQYLNIERYNIEALLIIFGFVLIEWNIRNSGHPFKGKWSLIKVYSIILLIIVLGVYSEHSDFIYFQF